MKPKILIFDEETSHNLGFFFGVREVDIHPENILIHWYIFCISYRWYGQKKINNISITDFPLFKKEKHSDIELLKAFSKILNEADYLVGHNIDRFDVRKFNARLVMNGLPPTKHTKTLDTLKMARRYFGFNHNSLGAVAVALGYKGKIQNEKGLWLKCFHGCTKSFKKMIRYCNNDIDINTFVFEKLMPFVKSAMISKKSVAQCQNEICRSYDVQWRGSRNGFKIFQCKFCKKWGQIRI